MQQHSCKDQEQSNRANGGKYARHDRNGNDRHNRSSTGANEERECYPKVKECPIDNQAQINPGNKFQYTRHQDESGANRFSRGYNHNNYNSRRPSKQNDQHDRHANNYKKNYKRHPTRNATPQENPFHDHSNQPYGNRSHRHQFHQHTTTDSRKQPLSYDQITQTTQQAQFNPTTNDTLSTDVQDVYAHPLEMNNNQPTPRYDDRYDENYGKRHQNDKDSNVRYSDGVKNHDRNRRKSWNRERDTQKYTRRGKGRGKLSSRKESKQETANSTNDHDNNVQDDQLDKNNPSRKDENELNYKINRNSVDQHEIPLPPSKTTRHRKGDRYENSFQANWRNSHGHNNNNNNKISNINVRYMKKKNIPPNIQRQHDENQMDILIEQLHKEEYDCMICCEAVKINSRIWSCQSCFHIYHLPCIRKWATSSAAKKSSEQWRCPACQNLVDYVPHHYKCFCGKSTNPKPDRYGYSVPHSCGMLCHKKRSVEHCTHLCNMPCHPGPCPPCPATINRKCSCGKSSTRVRCGVLTEINCGVECNKLLSCQTHYCKEICHAGDCSPCELIIDQGCYCGSSSRQALCGTGDMSINSDGKIGYYSCENICGRMLDCGNHYCTKPCHAGQCPSCSLLPENIKTCPCGKVDISTLLSEPRNSCTDAIPTCNNICQRELNCRDKHGQPHLCEKPCHIGVCGPCEKSTVIKCDCGREKKEIACVELEQNITFKCNYTCNKKKKCGRHRCNKKCCNDTEHICDLVCNRKLTCGLHLCQEPCHSGKCLPCPNFSIDELRCYCGEAVIYPLVPCGTRPPPCDNLCQREHDCDHPVTHPCQSKDYDGCPNCTFLTTKICMGGHKEMHNIPCHIKNVSCGELCLKKLPCSHQCQRYCHSGDCLDEKNKCRQPCQRPRSDCEHPCNSPCHGDTPCPDLPCKHEITIKCDCGRRQAVILCSDRNNPKYRRHNASKLYMKLHSQQIGDNSVDITDIITSDNRENRRLECDTECARLERNRALAKALDIQESQVFREEYSKTLLEEGQHNLNLVLSIEKSLALIVNRALETGEVQRFSFPIMKAKQRQIIHELAEHYDCNTSSYDEEPKRNTVATAGRLSRIPKNTLSEEINQIKKRKCQSNVAIEESRAMLNKIALKEGEKAKKIDYFSDDWS
ncbi:Transcriptional repressor NF-X1 [Trichoplax sp. H2]|nr:Transcriptional repressor NF-X1 [Trichoplax sp. H2]|eukprot:RDD42576.1 Transcriptional repressor NF-X1 [Trichoplax sp. H2]